MGCLFQTAWNMVGDCLLLLQLSRSRICFHSLHSSVLWSSDVYLSVFREIYHISLGFPAVQIRKMASPVPPVWYMPSLTEALCHPLPLLLPLTATMLKIFQKVRWKKDSKQSLTFTEACFWRLWNSSGNLDVSFSFFLVQFNFYYIDFI